MHEGCSTLCVQVTERIGLLFKNKEVDASKVRFFVTGARSDPQHLCRPAASA